jgi:hypothetical protein
VPLSWNRLSVCLPTHSVPDNRPVTLSQTPHSGLGHINGSEISLHQIPFVLAPKEIEHLRPTSNIRDLCQSQVSFELILQIVKRFESSLTIGENVNVPFPIGTLNFLNST